MTEQRGDSVIDILRSRLGPRHMSGIDEGRADIERVLRDELNMDGEQAQTMVQRMIDDGTLRYVTAAERDPEVDVAAQDDERSDRANQVGDRNPGAIDDRLGASIVPPTGGPQEGYSGLSTGSAALAAGAAMPVAGAGTGSAAAAPLAVAATDPALGAHGGAGYWDIGGGATGVVPSTTRKGQVEPKGT